MSFFVSLLTLWLVLLGTSSGITTSRSETIDSTSRTDMDELSILLEKHYSNHGEYPTEKELMYEYETALPGVDPEILLDGAGILINNQGSQYSYKPLDCTALGCRRYTLIATLSDANTYEKKSIR